MTAILALLGRVPLRVWVIGGIALAFLVLASALKLTIDRAEKAEAKAAQAVATSKALDKVIIETSTIRQEQKEQESEVDKIPGASDRLPDGFGSDLERVRQRQRDPR